jgi:hypothetical protein
MAPRVYFQFGSTEVVGNWIWMTQYAMPRVEKSSPECRYVLIARVDALEASNDPTLAIAKRRAEVVLDAFQARGIARDRFEIVIEVGQMSRSPNDGEGLRQMDRIVSIHSTQQGGRVVSCEGVPTCRACVLKLPSGGECHAIPGAQY